MPHKRYGTTYRLVNLVVVLQLATIVLSRGDVYVLGEAYAFGVVWSFAFKSLAMLVLRFKERDVAREVVILETERPGEAGAGRSDRGEAHALHAAEAAEVPRVGQCEAARRVERTEARACGGGTHVTQRSRTPVRGDNINP